MMILTAFQVIDLKNNPVSSFVHLLLLYTFISPCFHRLIHSSLHPFISPSVHLPVRSSPPTCSSPLSFISPSVHLLIHSSPHSLITPSTHLPFRSSPHPFFAPPIHLPIRSSPLPFISPSVHLLIQSIHFSLHSGCKTFRPIFHSLIIHAFIHAFSLFIFIHLLQV